MIKAINIFNGENVLLKKKIDENTEYNMLKSLNDLLELRNFQTK